MSWTEAFKNKIESERPLAPYFAIEFDGSKTDAEIDYVTLHSHGLDLGEGAYPHAISSISGANQSISVRSWSSNTGGLRVQLAGEEVAKHIAQKIPRGVVCYLRMGFDGLEWFEWGDFGPFVYEGISGKDNSWTMKLGGTLKVLQSNQNNGSTTSGIFPTGTKSHSLFDYSMKSGDFRDVGIDSGKDDWPNMHPALRSVAKVTPSEGVSYFYFTYEYLTGESEGFAGTIKNCTGYDSAFGVRSWDASGSEPTNTIFEGDAIEPMFWLSGTVPELFKDWVKGVSGEVDDATSRANSSIGFSLSSHDFSTWKERFDRYGTFPVNYLATKSQANCVSALLKLLNTFGCFIVSRQGYPAFRFAQDLTYFGGVALEVDFTITADDIVSMDNYSIFHPDARDVSSKIYWSSAPSAVGTHEIFSTVTQPNTVYNGDMSLFEKYVFEVGPGSAEGALGDAALHMNRRVNGWLSRIPDQMTLNLRGWKWLEMVPGDVCFVTCPQIPDFYKSTALGEVARMDREHFMCTAMHPNWNDATVTVELSRVPKRHNPYA